MTYIKTIWGLLLMVSATQTFAQTDKETTTKIVENESYIFIANTASPMANNDISKVFSAMPGVQNGSLIQLSGSQYDVRVTADSVVAYLPYFGRSFSAPYNPSEGGIKFTSKKFDYSKTKNRKGAYIVQINTKDVTRENYRFTINITPDGYASLVASSINKQPIVFNGYLEEPKKKEQ